MKAAAQHLACPCDSGQSATICFEQLPGFKHVVLVLWQLTYGDAAKAGDGD